MWIDFTQSLSHWIVYDLVSSMVGSVPTQAVSVPIFYQCLSGFERGPILELLH